MRKLQTLVSLLSLKTWNGTGTMHDGLRRRSWIAGGHSKEVDVFSFAMATVEVRWK